MTAGIFSTIHYYSSKLIHRVCVGAGKAEAPRERLMVPALKLNLLSGSH